MLSVFRPYPTLLVGIALGVFVWPMVQKAIAR